MASKTKKDNPKLAYEEWTKLGTYTKDYPIRKMRKRIFVEFLKNKPRGKVLDVGFYPGEVLKYLQKQGFEPYGVDVVPENVKEAKVGFPKGHVKLADVNKKIPFSTQMFDYVWAGDIIEHVYDTINLFKEFNRLLKVGGYLVVSTPYHGFLKMLAINLVHLHKHFHPEHYHIRFYTNKNLRMMLKKYGFSIEKEFYLGRIRPLANNMLFVVRKERDLDWDNLPNMFR